MAARRRASAVVGDDRHHRMRPRREGRRAPVPGVRRRGAGARRVGYEDFYLAHGVRAALLDALLREADIVTVHVPLDASTRNLIDARALALMKTSAFLINTARGVIVDEVALAAALDRGRLAGGRRFRHRAARGVRTPTFADVSGDAPHRRQHGGGGPGDWARGDCRPGCRVRGSRFDVKFLTDRSLRHLLNLQP